MGNNEFEKVRIKNRTSYYFDKPMKLEDFDIYNILQMENHVKKFLFMIFHRKL